MKVPLLILTVLVTGVLCGGPVVKETMDISFAPQTAMVINERQVQMFRAPLCEGTFLNQWRFDVRVYMMNVQWDSRTFGDDNWLLIRVFNSIDKTKQVCANTVRPNADAYCGPFQYNKKTWGGDDMYVEITASSGSPTYQYGLNLMATAGIKGGVAVPDAMENAVNVAADTRQLPLETLEQVAAPFSSTLVTGQTGQYYIPYCFEADKYSSRRIASTTLVKDNKLDEKDSATESGAGGVATYLCTNKMLHDGECFRSVAKRRGMDYFDASGAKVNTLSTKVSRAEFGPIYLLVLAQGDFRKAIDFTITAKLRSPQTVTLGEHLDHETEVRTVISYLKDKIDGKAPFVASPPDELKEEL